MLTSFPKDTQLTQAALRTFSPESQGTDGRAPPPRQGSGPVSVSPAAVAAHSLTWDPGLGLRHSGRGGIGVLNPQGGSHAS